MHELQERSPDSVATETLKDLRLRINRLLACHGRPEAVERARLGVLPTNEQAETELSNFVCDMQEADRYDAGFNDGVRVGQDGGMRLAAA